MSNVIEDRSHAIADAGDVIVINNAPVGSVLGIDISAISIQKSDEFFGFKDIPPGPHFVWGGSSTGSLRNGIWMISKVPSSPGYGKTYFLKWEDYSEVLTEETDKDKIKQESHQLPTIADKLKTYEIVNHNPNGTTPKERNIWSRLTSHIDNTLLVKITGHKGDCWQVSSSQDLKIAGRASADDENDNVLDFVFPRSTRTFTASSIGRERTEQAQDTTSHVKSIIADCCSNRNSDEIIGELQFCYISGMILGNLPCMEQWGHIVKIVFKAHQLAFEEPQFFVKFINAFHAQLIYDEEGIDGSILDQDPSLAHDLRMTLTVFKLRLNEKVTSDDAKLNALQQQVSKSFEDLELFLEKWNWDLKGNYVRSGKIQLEDGEIIDAALTEFEDEDERGEYAPQIIELDEHGREKGLFSM